MPPEETIVVSEERVACDGGGDALGHPRVFLEIDSTGEVVCPYCSRRFVLEAKAKAEPEAEAGA
jgi:uncharacterized Zn-finger protein